MYYQNDRYFKSQIQLYGCNYFCCLKIAELEATKDLMPLHVFGKHEIESLYDLSVSEGYMTKDCIVKKPSKIIQIGFRWITSLPIKVYQVGTKRKDGFHWWKWVQNNPSYKEYKYRILIWQTEVEEHFTLANKQGKEIYDPFPGNSKRYVKEELLYYVGV
jgi:hypothetical protein